MSSGGDLVDVSTTQLNDFYQAAIGLAQEAGSMIRDALKKDKKVDSKTSATDLVTETDTAVEKLLIESLKGQFPDHQFIGEESTSAAGHPAEFTNAPTWIIDPIDGTMNFVHSNQNVGISMALAVNRRVQIGIIYLPILNQMYTARRDKGAFCNGERIHVSSCGSLSKAMAMVEIWASFGSRYEEWHVGQVKEFISRVHAIRCAGAAVVDLTMVASGQADAYMHTGIHSWDIAAGALIVKEAGGVVLDPSGEEFDFMSRRILVASTEELAKEIIALGMKQLEFERDYPEKCPL